MAQHHHSKRILVQRNAAIGDVLLATSILPALHKRHPGYAIDFETSFKEVVENNPLIERVVPFGTSATEDYEIIIDLNLSYEKQPHLSILDAYAKVSNIKNDEMRLSWNVPEGQKAFATSILTRYGLENKNLVAIQSGASFWCKTMDPRYLETLISEMGKRFAVAFVLLGSINDPPVLGAVDLRGKTGIAESAAILQRCRGLIGLDSSLLHFAKAMGIPVAAFFGHSDPLKRMIPHTKDCLCVSSVPCRFCYHRQSTPVIISVCEKQNLGMRLVDSIIRIGLRRWYSKRNRMAREVAVRLLSFQKWRESGRHVAYCMKDLESPQTIERLLAWMQEVGVPKTRVAR